MEWSRSETLALALENCVRCRGIGLNWNGDEARPCSCVLRGIFRACLERFRDCVTAEKRITRASLDFTPGPIRKFAWGRKEEEYTADFYLVTRRALSPEDFRIFKYYHLYEAGWKMCTRKLGMTKKSFYQKVYGIERRLGRVFGELRPYPLFPLDEYFNGTRRRVHAYYVVALPPGSAPGPRPAMAKSA